MRSSFASASPAAAATSARSRRRSTAICTCAANAPQHVEVLVRRGRRRTTTSCSAGPIGTANVASSRAWPAPARRPSPPRPTRRPVLAEHGHRVGRERGAELRDELRQRILGAGERAAERGERLGLGAARRRVGGAAVRDADEPAHDAGDGEEDEEREQVLALLDGERVHRRREVVVGEQRTGDRGEQRREQPPIAAATTTTSARNSRSTLGSPRPVGDRARAACRGAAGRAPRAPSRSAAAGARRGAA